MYLLLHNQAGLDRLSFRMVCPGLVRFQVACRGLVRREAAFKMVADMCLCVWHRLTLGETYGTGGTSDSNLAESRPVLLFSENKGIPK